MNLKGIWNGFFRVKNNPCGGHGEPNVLDETTDSETVITFEEAFLFIITLLLIQASVIKIDRNNKNLSWNTLNMYNNSCLWKHSFSLVQVNEYFICCWFMITRDCFLPMKDCSAVEMLVKYLSGLNILAI